MSRSACAARRLVVLLSPETLGLALVVLALIVRVLVLGPSGGRAI